MRFTTLSRKEKSSIWYTAFYVLSQQPYLDHMSGNLGHTSLDRAQGEPICEGPRKDPILSLSGEMGRARTFV